MKAKQIHKDKIIIYYKENKMSYRKETEHNIYIVIMKHFRYSLNCNHDLCF